MPSGPPSLLVVHLDSVKLLRDGLHLGDHVAIAALISRHASGANVTVLDTTDRADLHRRFAALVSEARRFDVVVVIAHSNAQGIKIASDEDAFIRWDAFAQYLKPLQPRRLVLVACQAGQWPAAKALFDSIRSLRRIYAAPMNASRELASLMLLLVPHVVAVKVPKRSARQLVHAAAVALTGRQIRMWQRNDRDAPEGVLLDLAARALDPHTRQVPMLIRRILAPGR